MLEDKTKENTPDFLKGLSTIAPTGDNIEQELDTYFKKTIKELAIKDFNEIKDNITSNVRDGKYVVLKNGKKQIIEPLYLHGSGVDEKSRNLGTPRKLDEISKSKAEKFFLNHEIKTTDNHTFCLTITPVIDNKYNISFTKYSKIYLETVKALAEESGLKLKFYYEICIYHFFDHYYVEINFDDYYGIKQSTLSRNPFLKTTHGTSTLIKLKTALRKMRNDYSYCNPTPIIEFTAEFD